MLTESTVACASSVWAGAGDPCGQAAQESDLTKKKVQQKTDIQVAHTYKFNKGEDKGYHWERVRKQCWVKAGWINRENISTD